MNKNRLSQETSPYLKQHETNPVDWYPWGEEALNRSRAENKPILLSVGYSACHWCHVMAHESFEDAEVAQVMNENFVNIKIDREERPDIDQIYQNVAQVMTQGGGWPLTVFLTPDLKPFYGGTYFPPDDRYGRPGFRRLLEALSDAYRNQKEKIDENARYLTQTLSKLEGLPDDRGQEVPTWDALGTSAERLFRQLDLENGGFGTAPKFPNTMALLALWRVGQRKNYSELVQGAVRSFEKICRGGIFDQLGGGFHRYSVDATWTVPHFEKMLYDNALLLRSLAELVVTEKNQITPEQKKIFLDAMEKTVLFLSREMLSPEGLFYSALDADSEGEEGKFYVWSYAEVKARLDEREFALISRCYDVTEDGNFEHQTTILELDQTVKEAASILGISLSEARTAFESAEAKLMELRSRRIRPGLDDKALTAWNALMISGLVWTSAAFEGRMREKCQAMAQGAYAELLKRAQHSSSRLFSTIQKGQGKCPGYLDDYAFMARAALDLARIEKKPAEIEARIQDALRWCRVIRDQFGDDSGLGFCFTSKDHEALIQRPKTLFDQAIPSGSAVALEAMMVLAEISVDAESRSMGAFAGEQMAKLFPLVKDEPFGFAELLNTACLWVQGPVVLSGHRNSEACLTHSWVFQGKADDSQSGSLVCHRQTCSLPITDSVRLTEELNLRLMN